MTFKETLRKIWGFSSQKILAQRMCVSDRKVRRWIAADEPPVEAWEAVKVGIDAKIAELEALKREVR